MKLRNKNKKNSLLVWLTLLLSLIIFAWLIEFYIFSQKTVSILMYHNISKEHSETIYQRTKKEFIQDLDFIKRKNFDVISFNDLLNKKNIKNNSIIITFDDMSISQIEIAYPLLKKYNFKATFFVPTNLVNDDKWEKITEISNFKNHQDQKLFFIESHSHEHKALTMNKNETNSMYVSRIYNDLEESKKIINKKTNYSPHILALPYGAGYNNEKVKEIAKKLGFNGIRTSKWGNVNLKKIDWYRMRSWPILSHTTQLEIQIFTENRKVSRFFMRIYKKLYKLIRGYHQK
jgi:peptidoglycan/xylan/chitin deacetylase (PgdA/CDA1 family)